MADNKEKQGMLGEPFPNPAENEPTYEESVEDMEREEGEELGLRKPPYKSIWFWISFVSMNLAFLAASELLPVKIQEWVVFALVSLGHLGYGVTVEYFRRHQDQLHVGKPTYRRPAFWASWVAGIASFGLGSEHPETMEISGQVAMVLGYFGVVVNARIRRSSETDPEEDPMGFFSKVLTLIIALFTRKKKVEEDEPSSVNESRDI